MKRALMGRLRLSLGGSAAVCDSGGTRQLNCSHPFRGISPIKGCIKTGSLVHYVPFLCHFQVCPSQVLWPGLFSSWRLKKEKKRKKQKISGICGGVNMNEIAQEMLLLNSKNWSQASNFIFKEVALGADKKV